MERGLKTTKQHINSQLRKIDIDRRLKERRNKILDVSSGSDFSASEKGKGRIDNLDNMEPSSIRLKLNRDRAMVDCYYSSGLY